MNNINVPEMERFTAAVKKDSAQAKKSKCITGSWVFEDSEPQFISTVKYPKGNVLFKAELPPITGGWGTSPDPIQYCLYGLAACFAGTFMATATSEGVELKRLEVTAENWMDLRKQIGLTEGKIIEKVKLTVHAEGASQKILKKILKLAEERCPGTESLTQKIPLEVELEA